MEQARYSQLVGPTVLRYARRAAGLDQPGKVAYTGPTGGSVADAFEGAERVPIDGMAEALHAGSVVGCACVSVRVLNRRPEW